MNKNNHFSGKEKEIDALVKNEYIKEAKAIEERAMEGMEDFPYDREDEDRRFRQMMEELRQQGKLTPQEEEKAFGIGISKPSRQEMGTDLDIHREEPKAGNAGRRHIFGKIGKIAAAVAIVAGGIFAMGMTSEANRRQVMDTISYVVGNDVKVKFNSDVADKTRNMTETEARSEIEEELGIDVPILKYRVEGMKFEGFEIYPDQNFAFMHYKISENQLLLYISSEKIDKQGMGSFEGKETETVDLARGKVTAELYQEEDEKGHIIGAKWIYNNAYYQLSGDIEKEEFKKILEKIIF